MLLAWDDSVTAKGCPDNTRPRPDLPTPLSPTSTTLALAYVSGKAWRITPRSWARFSSQIWMAVSPFAGTARNLPSGLNSGAVRILLDASPLSTSTHDQLLVSQSRSSPSMERDAMSRPSWEKEIALTSDVCPSTSCLELLSNGRLLTFRIEMEVSTLATASWCPVGVHWTRNT